MIEGRFFEPMRSEAKRAWLSGEAGDLRLQIEGEDAPRRLQLVSMSDRLAGLPRKLVFADQSLFEAPATAPVDGLLPPRRTLLPFVHRLETSWRVAAAATFLSIALIFAVYRYGLPVAAWGAAQVTPEIALAALDHGGLQTLDGMLLRPTTLDHKRQSEIATLFDGLAKALPPGHPPLHLLFRNGGRIGPNAMALPGGTVIVTDQLIAIAKTDDEIAGVLAHEFAHVAERHSLQQLYRALGLTALVATVGGDSSQLVHAVADQAALLQTMAYSREFEAAADARSVALMVSQHRNPLAFIDLLDRIAPPGKEETDTGYYASHPGTGDRRKAAESLAQSLGWCKDCKPQP